MLPQGKSFTLLMLLQIRRVLHSGKKRNTAVTSGQDDQVWLGVMMTLVVTKKAPFSAGGMT